MMPDNDNSSSPIVTPTPTPTSPAWRNPCLFIALAALVLAGWQWLENRHQLDDLQVQVTRRLAEAEAGHQEELGARKQLLGQVDDLQAKLGALEGKLAEFRGQSESMQALYQDLTRSREEAILLEVEQAITLAGQQLQLAGNVPVAVLALQSADARLARLDRPQYLPLRKALAKDLARLNALPFVDLPGVSLRLEQVVAGIDKLPLAAYDRPLGQAKPAPAGEKLPWWQRTSGEIWQEIKGLVRIQRFDREEAVLLAPGQNFFLRENLKLRLLNARLALLARDQWTFRNELKVAQEWLRRHFVVDDKLVQAAQTSLGQMAATEINAELPGLSDSQAALRAVRPAKEKR